MKKCVFLNDQEIKHQSRGTLLLHLLCPIPPEVTVCSRTYILVFHHAVCRWKVGGELGKVRQKGSWDFEAARPQYCFPSLVSGCLYLSGNMLNLVHFTYVSHRHTHSCPSHPRAGAGRHPSTWSESTTPPPSGNPVCCLFTLHCDSSVCLCVCARVLTWGGRYCVSSALQG